MRLTFCLLCSNKFTTSTDEPVQLLTKQLFPFFNKLCLFYLSHLGRYWLKQKELGEIKDKSKCEVNRWKDHSLFSICYFLMLLIFTIILFCHRQLCIYLLICIISHEWKYDSKFEFISIFNFLVIIQSINNFPHRVIIPTTPFCWVFLVNS